MKRIVLPHTLGYKQRFESSLAFNIIRYTCYTGCDINLNNLNMRLTLEATDPTQDFIINLYENKVRIIDAIESPNGWLDLTLEGSEMNLLRVYSKWWCVSSVWENIETFDLLTGKDNGNGDE